MRPDAIMDQERALQVTHAWDSLRIDLLRGVFDRLNLPRPRVSSWGAALRQLEHFADDLAHAERAGRERDNVVAAVAHVELGAMATPLLAGVC